VSAVPGEIVRLAEWQRICEFAARTPATPAVLAVEGEAGAGKSTLWRAGAAVAADAGYRLLRSEPTEAEADLSFAGLSDLLTEILPGVAAQMPGPQREALEVALLLRPAGNEAPTAHAVGLAVLAGLRACIAEGPLLIAVDDVQWLDEASLDALAFALRRLDGGPLSVLLAARSEALADPLTVGAPPPPRGWRDLLAALPAAEEIDLAPLDMWQIQSLLPHTVTAAQARVVARQSRGNPFWAIQIAAGLDSAGAPVPQLARVLTGQLSRSLSTDAAEVLATVAAAGRIGVAEALAVLGYLPDPAGALDAAILAGVVVEAGNRITVAHPLIGAAAVESLPPGRRAALYRRLAAASPNPERYAHFAALAGGPGPDPAVADALDAAAAAAHARAASAAAGQFAAQAVRFTPEADGAALVRRRIRAAELLRRAGDFAGTLEHLQVLDLDRLTTADLERALPVLLDTAETTHGAPAATAIVSHAADSAGDDPRRRALALALASDVVYGIPGGRRAAALEAIGCAELAGDMADPALHRALINLVIAKVTAAEGLDSGLLSRAAALEASLPPLQPHDTADLCRGLWARFVEELDTARAALQRCITRAKDIGDDFELWIFLSYLATTEELAGDYTAAAAALRAADAAASWHDWPPNPWQLEPHCRLLIAAGDLDGALRIADRHLPDREGATVAERYMGSYVRGTVSAWRADPAAAVRHFELAAHCADVSEWADPGVRNLLDAALAEAYVAAGRPEEARRISSWLQEIGERLNRPTLTGDASRIGALAAAQDGALDRAAESARAAVAAHEVSPLRLELARSLLALGRIERRRKARKQSRDALVRARELATKIGHRPLLAQIEQELPRIAAARSGSELTATERRVAGLIAAGATNRDAAAELFVSVRTVETHVASIYRKLGVRTRAELARKFAAAGAEVGPEDTSGT
jgi:DNA-binding CsgD family transcriptional regulator